MSPGPNHRSVVHFLLVYFGRGSCSSFSFCFYSCDRANRSKLPSWTGLLELEWSFTKCIKDNQTEVCLALLNASLFPTRTQFHMTDRIAVNKLHSLTSGEAFIESYLELQIHSKITQNINNDQIGSHYAACLLPQYVDVFFTCECCVCQKKQTCIVHRSIGQTNSYKNIENLTK